MKRRAIVMAVQLIGKGKPAPCPTCNRAPSAGCSRVTCASRKPVTAAPRGVPAGAGQRAYEPNRFENDQ